MDRITLQEVILGACLMEANAYAVAKSIVTQDDFVGWHQDVFSAMETLDSQKMGIDLITVTEMLKRHKKLDKCGGAYAVASLTNKLASGKGVNDHAILLMDYSLRDKANDLVIQLGNAVAENSSVAHMLEQIQNTLDCMQGKTKSNNTKTLAAVMDQELVDRKERKGGMIGVSSGLTDFDRTIGGIYTGVHVIGARPAMGKTAFAVSVAINAVAEIPVVFWSGEMTADKIFLRVESNLSGIPTERLRINEIHQGEEQGLYEAHKWVERANFLVDDTPNLTMADLRVKALGWKSKLGRFMLVMDYLGLMDDGGDEYRGVTQNSKRIHAMANELDLPILLLHQLNRSVETRDFKIPQLSDLRASGGIEQDADTVSFLYRPHYYKLDRDPISGLETQNDRAYILVKKNREGKTGAISCCFEGHRSRYYN